MGIGRFFGKEGKKGETTYAQPAGSHGSQFFPDDNFAASSAAFPASSSRFPIKSLAQPSYAPPPIPDNPYVSTWDTPAASHKLPIKNLAPPTNPSFFSNPYSPTVSTRGGDSSWDPHTPSAELPARKRSKFPWRKSVVEATGPADPVVGEARMSGYFPPANSGRSSVIDTGTNGATPGSLQFSDASPASDVTSPPTSPLAFGNARQKLFGLRPATSTPNFHARTDSTPSFVSPSRHAKNASNLSSLHESPATSRPRRGSDTEPAATLSPFAAARDSMERERSPRRFGRRKTPARTSRGSEIDDEQLRNDAQEIIDVELAMAMSESLALHNAPKPTTRTSSPQPPAAAAWRNPSPVSSDLSDDMDLYSGSNDPQPSRTTQRGQRAAGAQVLSAQELADMELAQEMQREEEERARLAEQSQAPPGAYSYQPPGFHYPASTPRERRPYGPFGVNPFAETSSASSSGAGSRAASNPFGAPLVAGNPFGRASTARSVSNPEPAVNPFSIPPAATFNAPPVAAVPNNPFAARPKSPPETIDPDELLARQLQDEEDRPAPRQGPQVDNDMALAIQLAKEEDRRREANTAPKTRDCAVCQEASPIPELPALVKCEHEPQVCKDCYQGWIESELNGKNWKEIKCPETGCKELLQHAEVQAFATPEVYAKFDQLSAREALGDDPDFRWCKGPDCGSGQIHENHVSGNIFVCISPDCGFKMCTVHDIKWHEGETCEEYDYRTSGRQANDQKKAEELSQAAINQLTKACPGKKGKCGWKIEKNDGCDHMTCIKCKHQFCWMCMQDYKAILDEGNDKHLPTCNYHPSKLPDLPPEQAA